MTPAILCKQQHSDRLWRPATPHPCFQNYAPHA